MSLRSIKKQQQQQLQTQNTFPSTRQNLFKKYNQQTNQQKPYKLQARRSLKDPTKAVVRNLEQQTALLGERLVNSNPELKRNLTQNEIIERLSLRLSNLRTKSENDIITLIDQCRSGGIKGKESGSTTTTTGILSAKSEVCLQTIGSHNYNDSKKTDKTKTMSGSGARSHRDLTQSTYGSRTSISLIQPRRLSESSLNSAYSQQTSAMTTSSYSENSGVAAARTANLIIGIRGYEVIEERARFTVYKLRVENPITNDCWLVLRRYTDFVRLNNKLKQIFPRINLLLPRKKIFGDNFNSVFLDNRVQGLQMFVNSVMAREELRRCKIVREFFCLDEPPSYSESMEECRAIFEAQEETISHLKTQISSKNELILNLQKKLRDELLEKEKLNEIISSLSSKVCSNCSKNLSIEHNN